MRARNKRVESLLTASLQSFFSDKKPQELLTNNNQRLLMLYEAYANAIRVSSGKEAVEVFLFLFVFTLQLIRKSSKVKDEITTALTDHVMYFVVRQWPLIPPHLGNLHSSSIHFLRILPLYS